MQDLVYSSVAEDFASSPAAWDLRARRGLGGAGAAGASEAAVAETVGIYRQALAAVPGPEMAGLYAAFLREALAGALDAEAAAAADARGALQTRGAGLAKQLLELYAQAAAEGWLTEELALEWPKLALRCSDPAGALAAARAAARALPRCSAAWQQLLALEACQAAQAALAGGEEPAAAGGSSGSDSDSGSEEEGEPGGAGRVSQQARRLAGLALEALRSVGPAEAGPLWLAGLQALVGCSGPLDGLCTLLVETVSGLARGPVEVRALGTLLPCFSASAVARHQQNALCSAPNCLAEISEAAALCRTCSRPGC